MGVGSGLHLLVGLFNHLSDKGSHPHLSRDGVLEEVKHRSSVWIILVVVKHGDECLLIGHRHILLVLYIVKGLELLHEFLSPDLGVRLEAVDDETEVFVEQSVLVEDLIKRHEVDEDRG